MVNTYVLTKCEMNRRRYVNGTAQTAQTTSRALRHPIWRDLITVNCSLPHLDCLNIVSPDRQCSARTWPKPITPW